MPFLALAIGLRDAGHNVTLTYTSVDGKDYSNRDDIQGVELIRANGDVLIPADSDPYSINAKPGSFKEYSMLLEQYFEPFTEAMYEASEKLCRDNHLVVGHAACHTLLSASQKHDVPRVSLVLVPLIVRSKHISPLGNDLGVLINSMMWSIGDVVSTKLWFKKGREIREREGLPVIKSLQKELFTSDMSTIVASSEAIVPRQPDWNANIQVTGFLNLPTQKSNWKMPDDLRSFLDGGEPPVYMTFGSCLQFDLERSTELMTEAARLSGKRAIIQSDWANLQKPNDPNIFCIERIPHAEIFPYCSLIVHHGGAGTTQAALLAGKPSVVVAHGFDQPFWGKQLERLNTTGKLLQYSLVTASRLANEIFASLNNPNLDRAAKQLGVRMRKESGLTKAIWLLEQLCSDD